MTSEDTSAEAVAGPVELPSDSAHLGTDLQYKLRHQLNSASGWLFAIAGVTGINALLYVSQSDIRMLFGLISTQLLMVILGSGGPVGQTVALVGTFAIAAVFALFGVLTRKGTMWALWAGTIVYALDLLVLLGILGTRDVLGPALHAVAMVILGKAIWTVRQLQAGRDVRVPAIDGPDPAEKFTWRGVGRAALFALGLSALVTVVTFVAIWFVTR